MFYTARSGFLVGFTRFGFVDLCADGRVANGTPPRVMPAAPRPSWDAKVEREHEAKHIGPAKARSPKQRARSEKAKVKPNIDLITIESSSEDEAEKRQDDQLVQAMWEDLAASWSRHK